MARAPKFNAPQHMPPASGWEPRHRAPDRGYGNLEGVCIGDDKYSDVSELERMRYEDHDGDADDGVFGYFRKR